MEIKVKIIKKEEESSVWDELNILDKTVTLLFICTAGVTLGIGISLFTMAILADYL